MKLETNLSSPPPIGDVTPAAVSATALTVTSTGVNPANITTTSALDAPGLLTLQGGNGGVGFKLKPVGGATKYNWTFSSQVISNNKFEITPSTVEGGDTFTTPAFAIDGATSATSFYTGVNAQVGTTYTIVATDLAKKITFNNASDITVTLPQQTTLATLAGFWFEYEVLGAGTVTFVKEGAETLAGNTIAATDASGKVFRDTTTRWANSGGTAIKGFQLSFSVATVANQAYPVCEMGFSGTITSITSKCTSGTATATTDIEGVAVTATANAVSSTKQNQAVTALNTFVNGNFVNVTASANSTCLGMSITIKGTFRENI